MYYYLHNIIVVISLSLYAVYFLYGSLLRFMIVNVYTFASLHAAVTHFSQLTQATVEHVLVMRHNYTDCLNSPFYLTN